jgi:tartrate dehydrogenase/decarboxylase / D-malate dehydrogenase
MTQTTHTIAVIAGDGIGKEVIPAGMAAIETAVRGTGIAVTFTELPWGCEHYRAHGRMMAEDAFEQLADYDAIYLGAIGAPGVPDGISAAMILQIRQRFDQYVNLRPMRLLNGIVSPLAHRTPADIDMVCVRENSEGEYSGVGGRIHRGTPHEVAQQVGVFTRHGIERILRYGFALAAARPRRLLASATKSNALTHSMVLWDEIAEIVRADYPSVEYRKYHVDALAARMVTHPQTLDVMVASNLFGDILTDIGSAISGSLGIAPGANINPTRRHPSMFEPIHGSAPDIAGKGVANPIGAMWAGALMLDHLGHREVHDRILGAIERVVAGGRIKTPDLGGSATTREVADAIVAEIARQEPRIKN